MLCSSAHCCAVVGIVVHCPDTGVTEDGRFGIFLVFLASARAVLSVLSHCFQAHLRWLLSDTKSMQSSHLLTVVLLSEELQWCPSLVVRVTGWPWGGEPGPVHFSEARKHDAEPACSASWHARWCTAQSPAELTSLWLCFTNACLLSAFSRLDVDYSDEHCHLVSSGITLLSGRFNTELYLYLCNLFDLFMTDFTRLWSKQRCERSRSQRKAKIQSERNVSDKASVNQGKL